MTAAAHIVDFVHAARFADLPPNAVDAARTFLLDSLAVGVAGSGYDGADKALAAAQRWGEGGTSRVLGRTGVVLPVPAAALVNGYQIHCLEWDGLHEYSVVIALCAPLGALTAELDARPFSGADLLLAMSIGVEVAVLMGAAANAGPRFFRPAVAGLMGAAMAIAKVRGFSATQTAHTLGLAYSQVQGTMQAHWEGTMALALQVGFAARAAITAADLVEAGMTGPLDVIDGKFGYFALIERTDGLAVHLEAMGRPWKITQMAHKPYPAGRATQAALTALTDWRADHDFTAGDVERFTAHVPPLIELLVGRPLKDDMTPAYARLCLRFVAPLFLTDGAVDPRRFTADAFSSPALRALGARVAIVGDGNPDTNALSPQRFELLLKDGRLLTADVADPLGSPGRPLSREQQETKVAACLAQGATPLDADALVAAVQSIAESRDARMLLDCVPRPPDR